MQSIINIAKSYIAPKSLVYEQALTLSLSRFTSWMLWKATHDKARFMEELVQHEKKTHSFSNYTKTTNTSHKLYVGIFTPDQMLSTVENIKQKTSSIDLVEDRTDQMIIAEAIVAKCTSDHATHNGGQAADVPFKKE